MLPVPSRRRRERPQPQWRQPRKEVPNHKPQTANAFFLRCLVALFLFFALLMLQAYLTNLAGLKFLGDGAVSGVDHNSAEPTTESNAAALTAQNISVVRSSSTPRTINVFYHTFSGPLYKDKRRARIIVMAQLEQVGQAAVALAQNHTGTKWVLRYRSVGVQGPVTPQLVNPICAKYRPYLSCEYFGHNEKGHEESTLQQMHDFCQENPEEIVSYIHSKGTLHINPLNRQWRAPLTQGAIAAGCLETLFSTEPGKDEEYDNKVCTTCGLQLYPVWNLFYPGNFYAARCSYVRRLKPLLEYRTHMENVINATFKEPQKWSHDLYKQHYEEDEQGINGLGRFSNEQWIGSHPSIRPCDLIGPFTKLYPMVRHRTKDQVLQQPAQAAPRIPVPRGNWYRFNETTYNQTFLLRRAIGAAKHNQEAETYLAQPHEYYLLPGILYRFYKIYRDFPAKNSWIWTYYDQGAAWQARVDAAKQPDGTWDESMIW